MLRIVLLLLTRHAMGMVVDRRIGNVSVAIWTLGTLADLMMLRLSRRKVVRTIGKSRRMYHVP